MTDPGRELRLEDLPRPPLFKLVDGSGADVLEQAAVGGEPATVGALFASQNLAEEFSEQAGEFGMESLAGLEPEELSDWHAVGGYAAVGQDYVLVVAGGGTGLFHAGDVAQHAAERADGFPFPLYVLANERGESPLISVEEGGSEVLVAALFTAPEKARAFRKRASHLSLPGLLGTIEDRDGLRRHALVARRAGADYAVTDPEAGLTDAIPIEELAR